MMRWTKILMGSFLLLLLLIAALVSGLITWRLTATTNISLGYRLIIGLGIALVFMSPFLLRFPPSSMNETFCNILTYIAYFLFVCVFLFFSFMILRDIVWGILKCFTEIPSPFNPKAALYANVGLGILVVLLSCYALYEGVRVPDVKEVAIYSSKIKEPLRIVVLPDIHIHRALSKNKLQKIVEKTNVLQPNIIAMPGDIIDDHAENIKDLLPILSQFKAKLGIFATDGNHEIYLNPEMAKKQFEENGITYLKNSYQKVRDDVIVSGVPDIQVQRRGEKVDFKDAIPKTDKFVLLLAHTPKMFDLEGNIADLQISGHTHGGQIFPFHFLAKMSNWYLAGLYEKAGRWLYVSRGAGQWGPQMRLLAPAEITKIDIKKRKEI